jgi:hypothetical protein
MQSRKKGAMQNPEFRANERLPLLHFVSDGVQMRLAHARAAIQKQRVVGLLMDTPILPRGQRSKPDTRLRVSQTSSKRWA